MSRGPATSYAEADDKEIAERVLAGERELFSLLISRHKDMVYGMAYRYSGAEEAEDLAQEVFLRAFRALASFRGSAKFSTWLYRICRNLCLDSLRGKGRKDALIHGLELDEMEDLRFSVEAKCEKAEEGEELRAAIAGLKPRLKEPIILHYWQELSVPEAAAVLGIPERTMETRLYRARKALRKAMERKGL